jgi:hypothetical protein
LQTCRRRCATRKLGKQATEMENNSSNPANRRRSERVVLQMRVTVIAETPERTKMREEALTLVVNAHGGLIKLKMELLAGQPLVLVNPKSGKEQQCRVVRIEQPSPDYFAVAFEFNEPAPDFWPVVFPPADWAAKVSS